jgi:dTDP-4-amino-4,6-dideoxygalactose transaminase
MAVTPSRKVLLTTSCTHALEMSTLLLGLQPGDEVLMPSFTFVSTANAFALFGARPVFCDIRSDTLNLDEQRIEERITTRTRAIVPVHYAGVGCEMDALVQLAARHGLAIVEDNAHGLFGRYRGQALGSFGCTAALSFHETKNITCGEGGALLINDPRYIERAEIIREKGTDRSKFFRGQIDKYSWVDLGSSYLPSDILAAILFAQLERWQEIQRRRKEIWERYAAGLAAWANSHDVRLPYIPPHCEQAWHMFYLIMPTERSRDELIAFLKQREITSVFHYLPLHLSPMGRRFGGQPGDCPVTESVSGRLLRLPFYGNLSQAQQDRVIEAVVGWPG